MNAILEYLTKRRNWIVLTTGLIGVIMIGLLDYATGTELSFSLFYLIPVLYVAWFTDIRAAIAVSFASAISLGLANYIEVETFSTPLIHYWNILVRLSFFIIISLLLFRLKLALEREKELSRIDFLTRTVNRRGFYEVAEREIIRMGRYGHPFTVAFIDIDDFKAVNDRFGHIVGDQVLTTVVEAISQNLRTSDLVARIGGDEFVVLLIETGYDAAHVAIKKIQKALLGKMSEKGYPVTFSIGSLTCEMPPQNIDELIRTVDQLMYSIKESGKNGIRFSLVRPRKAESNKVHSATRREGLCENV